MTLILLASALAFAPGFTATAAGTGPGVVSVQQDAAFTASEVAEWDQDRSAPSGGWESTSFDGRSDVLRYGVDNDNPSATPTQSPFWRTEGLKTARDFGTSVAIDLYIDPVWQDRAVRAGVWAAGWHDTGRSGEFAIIEFTTAEPDENTIFEQDERWRVWVSSIGWVDVAAPFTYGEWASLRIDLDLVANEYHYFIDGDLVSTQANPSTTTETIGEVFLNSYNYAYEDIAAGFQSDSYDVHWGALEYTVALNSIQAAIDVAFPGATIDVGPGTYVEQDIVIHQEGITLRSTDGAASTIIDPDGAFLGIRVLGNLGDITVDGFTILESWVAGGIGQGLAAREGTALHVLNNIVMAPATTTQHGNGIQVTGDGSSVIGNTVAVPHQVSPDWSGSGILVFSADNVLVKDNTVTSSPNDYCIAIGGDNFGAPAANNNAVEGNLVHDCGTGVLLQAGVHDTLVTGNEIRDNSRGVYSQALAAASPSGNVVTGNEFLNNGQQVRDNWDLGEEDDAPDLDLEAILADNTFDRAVVVRGSPIQVPIIFSTIQDGVDAASAGQTVEAGAGTYPENVIINKDLSLLSTAGRDATTIEGSLGGGLGTVVVTGGTSAVRIGDVGQGFKIVGFDGPNPGLEFAALYLQGPHSGTTIVGNELVADGEHALLSEWARVLTDLVITDNVFSGKTFVGDEPAGQGTSQQFSLWNVPRQLVAIGHGGGASGFVFADNVINGTTGGLNGQGLPQGNTVVTMDAADSTITGNTFDPTTQWFANTLRARGADTTIAGNTFQSEGLTVQVNHVFLGAATADVNDVAQDNTFDRGAYAESGNIVSVGVQRSIDAAAAADDTVHVFAGDYGEALTVTKTNLQLLGANAGVPAGAADSRGPESTVDAGTGIAITVLPGGDGLSVDGFTLAGASGVRALASADLQSGLEVTNSILNANTTGSGAGVNVKAAGASAAIAVSDSTVTGFAHGLLVEGGSAAVHANAVQATQRGVALAAAVGASSIGNNTIEGAQQGIYLANDGNEIAGNLITGNQIGLWLGAGSNQIDGNLIVDNIVGIRDEGSGNVARHNHVVDNGLGVSADGDSFDARYNWWGALTGPVPTSVTGTNGVSGNVNATPWCLDDECSQTQPLEGIL